MASDEVKAAMLRLVAALEGDDEDKEEWLDGVRREMEALSKIAERISAH